jgi:GNAT superfamily N-acetyltransferase
VSRWFWRRTPICAVQKRLKARTAWTFFAGALKTFVLVIELVDSVNLSSHTRPEMAISIESWAASDRQAVIDLVLDIQRGEFGVPITVADQPDLADVAGSYGKGRGGFWVAREDDAIVGTIGLLDHGSVERGEHAAALRKMFVRRDRRGAAHGVAEGLISALLSHARAVGLVTLRLGTRPEMVAAHRFYEKHGFVRVDEATLPPSFPRMKVDSVFYRIDLT